MGKYVLMTAQKDFSNSPFILKLSATWITGGWLLFTGHISFQLTALNPLRLTYSKHPNLSL
jgi:hypothetical protein